MRKETYKSLISLNEFLSGCNFKNDYVVSTPTAGKFTYDTNLECIHLNSDAREQLFEINTEMLKIGDTVEIEVELANVGNGDLGSIFIFETDNGNNYHRIRSTNSKASFEKMKVKHIVRKNTRLRIGVGSPYNNAGEIKIRNFKVKTYSSLNNYSERKIVLELNNAFTNRHTVRNDYASDNATVTLGVDGIIVKWADPFTSGKRPVPSLTLDYSGNGYLYNVRVGGVTASEFIFKFYNATTGELVNIADLNLTSSVFLYATFRN